MKYNSSPTQYAARLVLLLSMAGMAAAFEARAAQPYVTEQGTCAGFPRVAIDMIDGFCAGLVLAPEAGKFGRRQIKTPRMLLRLDDDDHWLITDLGNWMPSRGKVWRMTVGKADEPTVMPIIEGLSMPHTIASGPDHKIYVGEMSRIIRFDAYASSPRDTVETVIDGLPDNRLHENRHPLSHFVFDGNGDLLVNVGASTDQCTSKNGSHADRCLAGEGREATGVIRRYRAIDNHRWSPNFEIVAVGLRNSLVLVRHSSGTILQAENSYDYAPDRDTPFDEINVIRQGAHYGWPYCADNDASTPIWSSSSALDCKSKTHEKPVSLLPPHAAPLHTVYYEGAMFPQLQGQLLMSWHGYRATGSRLVAFQVDSKGVPVTRTDARYAEYSEYGIALRSYGNAVAAAEPLNLTERWALLAGKRPSGAPVGIAVAGDGALWVADDRNASILRIAADGR